MSNAPQSKRGWFPIKGIRLEEKEDVAPICPHCEEEVYTIWMREIVSGLGRRYLYFCPHCRKVLGVSHRKGFFMG